MQTPELPSAEKLSALIEEQALTREDLIAYLRQMKEIRALENNIAELLDKAVLKGASHLYAGQEAVAVGAVAALRDDDLILSGWRIGQVSLPIDAVALDADESGGSGTTNQGVACTTTVVPSDGREKLPLP